MMKAILFDLDGTLYDKSGLARRLIVKTLLAGDLSLLKRERQVRKELRGQPFDSEEAFYEAFFSRFPRPEIARRWYFERYMPEMVRVLRSHFRVADWVPETMRSLRSRNCRIVVFSDYGSVHEKLKAIGFDPDWADHIFDAPSLGGLKPCRKSFEKICRTLKVLPSECLMVGDREDTDGDGARAVGMPFVKVKNASRPSLQKRKAAHTTNIKEHSD